MPAPEFRRIMERLRELAVQAAGSVRVLPSGRFEERLPEGLTHDEQARRAASTPRVEVRPLKAGRRKHAPTGSKQIRDLEVEIRVVRALPLEVIQDDDARYDAEGLAVEDGELLARVYEWPANLERTEAGELTGLRSLVYQGNATAVRAPRNANRPQLLETIHRFRGWCVLDVPIA